MIEADAHAGAFGAIIDRAARRVFPLLIALPVTGCGDGVLDPHGPIAADEREILFNSLGIMLAIVVPTIIAILGVAYWFRASNARAEYLPEFRYSGRLEMLVWSIPAMTVFLLGSLCWVSSHDLDPPKPIASTVKPVTIQVVSLDWKWLFIYPDEGVGAVNTLTIPAGTPINLQLTSSAVMNSFFVSQLAGQIYTMGGMTTRLNFLADGPGTYEGRSFNFSGDGFSDMHFLVHSVTPDEFAAWVAKTQSSGPTLDRQGYDDLAKPTEDVAPYTYSHVSAGLFGSVATAAMPFAPFCTTVAISSRRIGF
jgi:cytochrome o ubiquinol oxidase subunit II